MGNFEALGKLLEDSLGEDNFLRAYKIIKTEIDKHN